MNNQVVKNKIFKNMLRGFSLIEIMVVVTLIAILGGTATVYFAGVLERGKIDSARAQAQELGKALDMYKLQNGSYPSSSEGLEALVRPVRGGPGIMEKLPLDPWKREFEYSNPGVKNPNGVDVWSNGPNGDAGREADIGNWIPDQE